MDLLWTSDSLNRKNTRLSELHPKNLETNPTLGVFFMTQYDEDFKRSVVQDYLTGSGGYKSLATNYALIMD